MTVTNTPRIPETFMATKALAGTPPDIPEMNMLSEEEREQAARVKRFLALTVRLQEGVLRYGERLKRAYRP